MGLIGTYIPYPYVTPSGVNDATASLVVLGVLLLAVIVTGALYYLWRPRKATQAVVTEEPVKELPKAA